MIYALDVDYRGSRANVASIGFKDWVDSRALYKRTHTIEEIAPYQSGLFYKRELPCLLKALEGLDDIEFVIVDGYVWLREPSHYGLGMYLYSALKKKIPIIGVAKNRFQDTPIECELFRGRSKKPLYITSIGIDLEKAKYLISKMYGEYRLPNLLKEADTLCRKKL
jgi:deoxyribonuclease V